MSPMGTVLQLRKRLAKQPVIIDFPEIELRNYGGDEDFQSWLEMRSECYSGLTASAKSWTAADFGREFLSRGWWNPESMWFATSGEGAAATEIGSVTLSSAGSYRLQWLMVRPDCRRQGVGRALVVAAERRCWELGGREIELETLDQWTAATSLYRSLGYV